ncbi:MAG: hypothetical protein AAB393_19360 [Bacteroidota bacterium]
MSAVFLCAFLFLLIPSFALAQKIGVLPFEDASGVGPEFGENVAKFIRSEFLKNKKATPKFIQYKPAEGEATAVDVDKATWPIRGLVGTDGLSDDHDSGRSDFSEGGETRGELPGEREQDGRICRRRCLDGVGKPQQRRLIGGQYAEREDSA